jgi:hypothetical protein
MPGDDYRKQIFFFMILFLYRNPNDYFSNPKIMSIGTCENLGPLSHMEVWKIDLRLDSLMTKNGSLEKKLGCHFHQF